MFSYKILKFRIDLCDIEEIETELNNYAKDNFRVINVISTSNSKGDALYFSGNNEIIFTLEKN